MEPAEYDNIANVEEKHWWYRGMAAISLTLLRPRVGSRHPPPRILDAGCGPGGMLSKLREFGQPFGIDFHPLAIAHAAGNAPLARVSVEHLPFANSSFDIVTSFDVVCHRSIADDGISLREFARVLKSGGALLIRVPALEALRGAHDEFVHTARRYSAPELESKLRAAGFHPQRLTYANTLLLPFVLLRRKLQNGIGESASDVEMPSPVVNRFLEFILAIENLYLSYFGFPAGVSLFALARK
ncbi:MAG: class I SAM-dependent methyltransferase [Chloroflexi bacterium]|nr:class I SAM-dependent methyltransferase [Chloroflexota bacterium]